MYVFFVKTFKCIICFVFWQKIPIEWSIEHGLDTVITGNGNFTLNFLSRLHGISIEYLLSQYPDLSRDQKIPVGKIIRFNKPDRWLVIAKWFSDWDTWVRSLDGLTRAQQNRLFITHQLHTDLQRTCHSMYNMIQTYVVGNPYRKWVPHRFSQDIVESFFSEVRQSAGGNADACREHVDRCIQHKRWKQKHQKHHNSYFKL